MLIVKRGLTRAYNSWERKLSKSDIRLIVEFLKEEVPEVYRRGEALDAIAARALVNGFLAYGWTLSELSTTQSSLIEQLKLYISMDEESEDSGSAVAAMADSQLDGSRETTSIPTEERLCRSCHKKGTPNNHQSLPRRGADITTPLLAPSPQPTESMSPSSHVSPVRGIAEIEQYESYDSAPASDDTAAPQHLTGSTDYFDTDLPPSNLVHQGGSELFSISATPVHSYCEVFDLLGSLPLDLYFHGSPAASIALDSSVMRGILTFPIDMAMDLDDPTLFGTDFMSGAIGTSSLAQSEQPPTSESSHASITAITGIDEDFWTSYSSHMSVDGRGCGLSDPGVDLFWGSDVYNSQAAVDLHLNLQDCLGF